MFALPELRNIWAAVARLLSPISRCACQGSQQGAPWAQWAAIFAVAIIGFGASHKRSPQTGSSRCCPRFDRAGLPEHGLHQAAARGSRAREPCESGALSTIGANAAHRNLLNISSAWSMPSGVRPIMILRRPGSWKRRVGYRLSKSGSPIISAVRRAGR